MIRGDTRENVVGSDATGVASEDPVIAQAQDSSSGMIGNASYTFDSNTGALTVSNGSLSKSQWDSVVNTINKSSIKSVTFTSATVIGDTQDMFSNFSNLTTVDASGLDVSTVGNMGLMFNGCSSLTSVNLSGWDTSKVTTMSNMFSGCSGLTTLGLSGWDTSNVTTMSSMFSNCSNLRTIAVCSWNTDNVSGCSNIFQNCTNLKGGKGTAFDTSHINDMTYARVDGGYKRTRILHGKARVHWP